MRRAGAGLCTSWLAEVRRTLIVGLSVDDDAGERGTMRGLAKSPLFLVLGEQSDGIEVGLASSHQGPALPRGTIYKIPPQAGGTKEG